MPSGSISGNHHGHEDAPATMLIYQVRRAGVSYEASQDVTYLRAVDQSAFLSARTAHLGEVRFPPTRENSMVIAEGWMGLRQ